MLFSSLLKVGAAGSYISRNLHRGSLLKLKSVKNIDGLNGINGMKGQYTSNFFQINPSNGSSTIAKQTVEAVQRGMAKPTFEEVKKGINPIYGSSTKRTVEAVQKEINSRYVYSALAKQNVEAGREENTLSAIEKLKEKAYMICMHLTAPNQSPWSKKWECLKNKMREDLFALIFHEVSGTLTIIVRGSIIKGIYFASDGLTFRRGKPTGDINVEKVFAVNKHVIAMLNGTNSLPRLIVEELRKKKFDSAIQCAEYTKHFMADAPAAVAKLICHLNGYAKFVIWCQLAFNNKLESLKKFNLYFGSFDDGKTTLAIYNGDSGNIDTDNPHPSGFVTGHGAQYAHDGYISARDNFGDSRYEDNDLFTSRCIMQGIAEASAYSRDGNFVGGRIIIKRVDEDGVCGVWDGPIAEMVKKHKISF